MILLCWLFIFVTNISLATVGVSANSSSPQVLSYHVVAKLEEEYVPIYQPVAYSCSFRGKTDAESFTNGISDLVWSSPLIVSHNQSSQLWNSDDVSLQVVDLEQEYVHDYQTGNSITLNGLQTLSDLLVDRHHSWISAMSTLVNVSTGFSAIRPVNEASNTWWDSFVIDTYPVHVNQRNLRGRTARSAASSVNIGANTAIASWDCERQRYEHEQKPLRSDDVQSRGRTMVSNIDKNKTVAYEIIFQNLWTKDTHPFQFPDNASFTDQIIITHNGDYKLFRPGHQVSTGFKIFCEEGNFTLLEEELSFQASAGAVASISRSSGRNLGVVVMDSKHDVLSIATRLDPSPDWFTGLSKIHPIDETGHWLQAFSVEVFPLDAGTDKGLVYTDSAEKLSHDPVTQITAGNINRSLPVFLTVIDGNIAMLPIGRYDIRLVDTSIPTSSPAPSSTMNPAQPSQDPTTEAQFDKPFSSKISIDETVQYEVFFENKWSKSSHPFDFPKEASFGKHIVVSHSKNVSIWEPGQNATNGLRAFVADGYNDEGLLNEIGELDSEIGDFLLEGSSDFLGYLQMDSSHKQISSLCSIRPSPDWFTGLLNVEPYDAGFWVETFSIDVFPFDAGVVDGKTYKDEGKLTTPQQPILAMNSSIIDPVVPVFEKDGNVLPIGRYLFRLVQTMGPTSVAFPNQAPNVVGSPSPSGSQLPSYLPSTNDITDFFESPNPTSVDATWSPIPTFTTAPSSSIVESASLVPSSSASGSASSMILLSVYPSVTLAPSPVTDEVRLSEPTSEPSMDFGLDGSVIITVNDDFFSEYREGQTDKPSASPSLTVINGQEWTSTMEPSSAGTSTTLAPVTESPTTDESAVTAAQNTPQSSGNVLLDSSGVSYISTNRRSCLRSFIVLFITTSVFFC